MKIHQIEEKTPIYLKMLMNDENASTERKTIYLKMPMKHLDIFEACRIVHVGV